jgi:hypothetical protein
MPQMMSLLFVPFIVSFPEVPTIVQIGLIGVGGAGDTTGLGEATYGVDPATYPTELLFAPNPFLFFELAITRNVLPDFNDLIVQEVFAFLIVQDLPPAVILLPVIFAPPSAKGSAIVTVTLTLPFLGAEELTETIVGDEGLLIFVFA